MLKTFLILIFCNIVAAQDPNNQFRQYTCIEHQSTEVTDCRLTFMTSDDEPITITESGCFMEKKEELRNFCPLQCANADFAYVIGRRPDTSSCIEGVTFDVVRRRGDWLLWRSSDCLTEEIQFDLGCINSQYLDLKNVKP